MRYLAVLAAGAVAATITWAAGLRSRREPVDFAPGDLEPAVERVTYGWEKTIHRTTMLNVELSPQGHVVAVWFRCQPLPFDETLVDEGRAREMRQMYSGDLSAIQLLGVDLERPT